jgi:hypothetical protein
MGDNATPRQRPSDGRVSDSDQAPLGELSRRGASLSSDVQIQSTAKKSVYQLSQRR